MGERRLPRCSSLLLAASIQLFLYFRKNDLPSNPPGLPFTLSVPPCRPNRFTVYAFAVIVAVLFLGPEDRLGMHSSAMGVGPGCKERWEVAGTVSKPTAFSSPLTTLNSFSPPHHREHNFALNLFWCVWWPASFLVFPFLGRIWCAVCPFMIYGELVQRWRIR